MSSMPDLRLAPLRMVSLAETRGPLLDSMSKGPEGGLRQTVGLPAPGIHEPEPRDAQRPPLGITGPEAGGQTAAPSRPAWNRSQNPEHMDPFDEPPVKEFHFADFLDIINPLQHIPIVGTIYRAITGDEISSSASIFGGFLFGGPLGFVMAIANAIFEEANGQDLGETVLAALLEDDTAPDVQTAQTPSANSTTASLEVATPTQDSQALVAAATATASTTQKAGDYLGSSENLTGQLALGAFVRDLRKSEQLARTALATVNPAQAEISGAPALPKAATNDAQPASPAVAMQNPPGMAETRASTATQNLHRNAQSLSEPRSDPQRDNPGVPVAIQARAPDARLLDPRTMGATLPASAFAERMLHALNKYLAIARDGERNGNDRGFVLDAHL